MAKKSSKATNEKKSIVVTAKELEIVAAAAAGVAAPAGAGVGASGASAVLSGGVAPAVVAPASVADVVSDKEKTLQELETAARVENLAAAPAVGGSAAGAAPDVSINEDSPAVSELRQKIASYFAAPDWSGAAADVVRAGLDSMLAAKAIDETQYNKMWSAAARNAGVDLSPRFCSVARVLAVVRSAGLVSDFESVVGASFNDVRLWLRGRSSVSFSLRLPLSLVTADSEQKDFVLCSSVPAGSSASACAAAVLSVRFLAGFKSALAAASTAARSEYLSALETAFRFGSRLHLSLEEITKDLRECSVVTKINDDRDTKRLEKNLASCWASCKRIEVALVLAGCPGALEINGGFVFPAAGLPASASAKVRKLWSKRERVLSSIKTVEMMLKA